METNELNEVLKNNWSIVPEDVRALVLSTDFETKLNWVGGKYNLTTEQTDTLKQETIFVLLGIVQLKDYVDSVSIEVGLPQDQAKVIAQEVGTQVFAGVKESLKEIGLTMEMAEKKYGVGVNVKNETQPKPVSGVLIQQAEKKEIEKAPQINRAVLLQEIKRPALIEAHAQNQGGQGGTIVDEKLSGMVKIPREESHVDMTKISAKADPYRESI